MKPKLFPLLIVFLSTLSLNSQEALAGNYVDFETRNQIHGATINEQIVERGSNTVTDISIDFSTTQLHSAPFIPLGDVNGDGVFNSTDLLLAFASGKFETGEAASWSEGDWNFDGVFNSDDLVDAFSVSGYAG